jgi:hypothetical protein
MGRLGSGCSGSNGGRGAEFRERKGDVDPGCGRAGGPAVASNPAAPRRIPALGVRTVTCRVEQAKDEASHEGCRRTLTRGPDCRTAGRDRGREHPCLAPYARS